LIVISQIHTRLWLVVLPHLIAKLSQYQPTALTLQLNFLRWKYRSRKTENMDCSF